METYRNEEQMQCLAKSEGCKYASGQRILLFAQRDEAEGAASKQDEKEKPDDFFIFQRIFGQTHDRITLGFAPARPAAADKRPP